MISPLQDSIEKARAREQQRNHYQSLSPSEKIARNRKQYAMRKKYLRKMKPEDREEWYNKKAERERERKAKIK